MPGITRRSLLRLAAAAGATAAVGCGGSTQTREQAASTSRAAPSHEASASTTAQTAVSTAAPTSRAAIPRGRIERTLLDDTPSATTLIASFSGREGPVLMVLGGVHGNEPGGWLAAEQIAAWEPTAGGLIVVPQANRIAAANFVRTTDELGDLNRLYPGNPASILPMERMAAEIIATAREFHVDVLLDLHESWAFFAERTQSGTAFLGQTVTTGIGPRDPELGRAIIERVNATTATGRDLLIERDGSSFRRDPSLGAPGIDPVNRRRSSLSLGGHVDGLTPILVEMGQQDQPVERRTELHLAVAHAAMQLLEIA